MSTILYNENKVLHVHRMGEKELKSECYILSNDIEVSAWIIADINDFTIYESGWEVYRHPEYKAGHYPLPELKGIRAYLEAGGSIREKLSDKDNPLLNELIFECVRGYVQTVCLLLKEHGFADTYEYFMNFKHLYDNSCLLYSDGKPEHIDWSLKVHHQRETVIFNRINSVTIYKEEDGSYFVCSSFNDSHHQLGAILTLDEEGTVIYAEGDYARVPDPICRDNYQNISNLIGTHLPGMSRKKIGALVGGSHGCDHMVNMFHNTALALTSFMK